MDRRERRRQAMMDAARELFVERGYDAVSLSEIVKRSGGSLATLYELFENKAGLLGAIVANKRFGTHEQIDALIARGGVPAVMIKEIAEILIENFSESEMLGLI
ncbi:MAG: TetR/AcrR family transcriptional regulator, partial [Sphingomonadaceae bacterium]